MAGCGLHRAVALLTLLAACGGGGHDERVAGLRPYTATARFLPGDEVTVIQVDVSDRQPLRGAELVGPDGTVIAAESVDANAVATQQQPFYRAPVGGVLGSGGAGIVQPFGGLGAFAAGSQTTTSGQIQSTALIRLPDPAAYAKDWNSWQIRLRIGDPPHATVLELAAPQPPPSL